MKHSLTAIFSLCCAVVGLTGCYNSSQLIVMNDVQTAVQQDAYDQAETLMENKKELQDEKNQVLYFLEMGVITHLGGKYADSNSWFEQAARRMEELDVISVSGTAADWVLTERFQPYRGEDFERVLVHYYMALNYVMLGQLQDALVECRRINTLLQEFNQRYEQKNRYKTDAFALYLSGLIYDAMGELNDARVDYQNAYETYNSDYVSFYGTSAPEELRSNLLRTASALGFHDIVEQYRGSAEQWTDQATYRQSARLIVIWENGLTPYKVAKNFRWYSGLDDWDDDWDDWGDDDDHHDDNDDDDIECYVKFSFAEFVPRVNLLASASVSAGGVTRSLELAENVAQIAQKNLNDRRLRAVAQAISRNLLKCVAQESISDDHWFWKWLLFGLTEVSEQADVRHWFLLPADIHITQLVLPPGTTDVELTYFDAAGKQVKQSRLEQINLQAGQTKFIIQRTF